jgi:hypothetical protein
MSDQRLSPALDCAFQVSPELLEVQTLPVENNVEVTVAARKVPSLLEVIDDH